MAEITRSSRMAIVEEVTEGTLVDPSAGADYIPLREGFSSELGFEVLQSDEIKASIGQSKGTVGFESPAATIPMYLKHSGTEGVAPNSGVHKLLKAAFGSVSVNSTQYDTVVGSTTTAINVDTGEGANFSVGEAVLVKHAAAAWEIAVIKSIAGDVLTPLFALQTAPATGTNLGKAIHYNVADSGHPSLSLHDYRGNGGAYQAIAGCRVVGMSVDGSAGEFIESSFDIEGIQGYFNPIRIAATDTKLDFIETGPTTRAATITAGLYLPNALAQAIEDAMNAVATDNFTVTYNNTGANAGKFTITSDGSIFTLDSLGGANAANTIFDKIGFSTAADHTGALTYTSDTAQSWASPQTPALDATGALVAKNNKVMLGLQSDNVCFSTQQISYSISEPKTDVLSICAESGKSGSLIASREVTVSLVANLTRHQADIFEAMKDNTSLGFQWAFGNKSAGNWIAGQSGVLHLKECTVESHVLGDSDGLVTIDIELRGHVDSSANAETALNLL